MAHIKVFPHTAFMNVTLSLDDNLVKEIRKIAVERDTTLTGLIRQHLEALAAESTVRGRRRREREALEKSFTHLQVRMGSPTWKRDDLYDRSCVSRYECIGVCVRCK